MNSGFRGNILYHICAYGIPAGNSRIDLSRFEVWGLGSGVWCLELSCCHAAILLYWHTFLPLETPTHSSNSTTLTLPLCRLMNNTLDAGELSLLLSSGDEQRDIMKTADNITKKR